MNTRPPPPKTTQSRRAQQQQQHAIIIYHHSSSKREKTGDGALRNTHRWTKGCSYFWWSGNTSSGNPEMSISAKMSLIFVVVCCWLLLGLVVALYLAVACVLLEWPACSWLLEAGKGERESPKNLADRQTRGQKLIVCFTNLFCPPLPVMRVIVFFSG